MEDDGEIDSDFPPLESREPVSKFGFDQLGLVVNHSSSPSATATRTTPVTVSVHLYYLCHITFLQCLVLH